jgi:DNA topoisomerase-1
VSTTAPARKRSLPTEDIKVDPRQSAAEAGLVYVSHHGPGITRRRAGKSFTYLDSKGKRITDAAEILRIRQLAIPPAYRDVWICPSPRGHIQAVGKDARGRTQYRYHPRWRQVRDESKYGRMIDFGKALPAVRRTVNRHLRLPGLPRERVLATVVKLLETTLIRVGNEEYAKENQSFGLTTIRNQHVEVAGSKIHFEFRGKSGVDHAIDIRDRRLAEVVQQCQELPEQELFEYIDQDGTRRDISSGDVNQYLREITGRDFTAKDFRTWAGTVLAAMALQEFESFASQAQAKRNVVAAIERVAKKLGNTKAVCRKCYVHPAIIDTYLDGRLAEALKQRVEAKLKRSLKSLRPEEAAVMAMLQERLTREAKKGPAKAGGKRGRAA